MCGTTIRQWTFETYSLRVVVHFMPNKDTDTPRNETFTMLANNWCKFETPKSLSQLDIEQRLWMAIAQLRTHCSYTTQAHKTQHFFMLWAVPVCGRSVTHSPHPFVTQNANNPTASKPTYVHWETDCWGSHHLSKPLSYWECNYISNFPGNQVLLGSGNFS